MPCIKFSCCLLLLISSDGDDWPQLPERDRYWVLHDVQPWFHDAARCRFLRTGLCMVSVLMDAAYAHRSTSHPVSLQSFCFSL